ncbi:MAG: hypothetical protein ABIV47_22990 [Roseiflexaceae bacterium]
MANTILGIFDDPTAARRAVETLRAGPLKLDDVSIISRATESGVATGNSDDVSAGQGAAVGAVWGGLVGLAALLIPGVGPFIALGALGAALTGVVTGAVVGGISAALIDFGGIPKEEARGYEQQVHSGKTLVAVKSRDEDALEVRRVLAAAGADSIRDNQTDIASSSSAAVHVAMYDGSGQPVNEAEEYGAPINPTTVRRYSEDEMPIIEPGASIISPVVETTAADRAIDNRRTGQVQPSTSTSVTAETGDEDVKTPEDLGSTIDAARRRN